MQENTNNKREFTFEICEHICVLGRGREEGFTKEFNRVSFRGLPAKFDIREWNSDHSRMTKGMTLTDDEMETILEAMNARRKALTKDEEQRSNPPKQEVQTENPEVPDEKESENGTDTE